MPSLKPIKKIAVIVESSRAFGRGLIQSICDFANKRDDWQLCFHESTLDTHLDAWLEHWQGDGILMRVSSEHDAKALLKSGIPAVDLLGEVSEGRFTTVDTDNSAFARMAVDFYTRSGHHQLAYCGYPGICFSDERQEEFNKIAEIQHLKVFNYASDRNRSNNIAIRESWHPSREDELASWLSSLPKPIALFACNDVRALEVSAACRLHNIKVPEEVSIMGVDNDPLICNMSHPPLTSIIPDLDLQGRLGAELLASLIEKKPPKQIKTSIPPIGIEERPSTDTILSEKEHVIVALRYARAHFHQSIGTDEVASACGVSRSLLDRDLKAELGFTISSEIKRLRLVKIKNLLWHSELTLQEMAQESGFVSGVSLSNFFKSHTGMTPGKYKEIREKESV